MNLALCFNDVGRFWTLGSFVIKELAKQDDIVIKTHCRIPEDTGILQEQCKLDLDLILVIDCGTHFKLHHEKGKLGKAKTAFWVSDLHRSDWAKHRLQMIREFKYDHVFYAQKNFKNIVMQQGYAENQCSWLPHAVDTDIFKPLSWITKKFDTGYVGYLNDRRKKMSEIVSQFVSFKHYSSVWTELANRCLNECKILWNCSVEQDINMRVFESLATGIPLITDKIVNNGFEDLFEDDKDLLTYSNEQEMKEKIVRLIASPDLRKYIGENGRKKVLMYHSYRNRINTILGTMGFPLLQNYNA